MQRALWGGEGMFQTEGTARKACKKLAARVKGLGSKLIPRVHVGLRPTPGMDGHLC